MWSIKWYILHHFVEDWIYVSLRRRNEFRSQFSSYSNSTHRINRERQLSCNSYFIVSRLTNQTLRWNRAQIQISEAWLRMTTQFVAKIYCPALFLSEKRINRIYSSSLLRFYFYSDICFFVVADRSMSSLPFLFFFALESTLPINFSTDALMLQQTHILMRRSYLRVLAYSYE